jgi:DNA-binding NtrC family response regulator
LSRTLLVIDDDEASCRLVKAIFEPEGIDVVAAHDGSSGLARVERDRPDLVLLDLRLPGIDGLEVLEKLKARHASLLVIMLTADQDLKTAVRATQLGAFDYLTKPVDEEEIVVVVKRALETRALELEVEELRQKLGAGGSLAAQMGSSPQVRQVIDQVRIVGASSFTVLIQGETGAGKELVAQAVHRESARRQKPFQAVDCGAIPEQLLESELFGHEKGAFTGASSRRPGRFQLAEGGTLFLDEVGNLPMSLQAKLLRVLESRQVQPVGATRAASMDLRFIAATNQDLQARVTAGLFRTDLYFRLAQYTISLPPLRERPADIPYLAQRFLEEASVELRRPVQRVLPEALELLERHAWPGNVRELRNVIRHAVLQTNDLVIRRDLVRSVLGKANASVAAGAGIGPGIAGRTLREIAVEAAEAAERQAICETLRATRGNKSQAAKALKTDYKTLHVKLKHLGIRAHDFSQ